MAQLLFLAGLYAVGVMFGLLFKHQLPVVLIASTGFLWGALIWVSGGLILLTASIPYTPLSMFLLMIGLGVGLGLIHVRNKTWQLSRTELKELLPIVLIVLLGLILAGMYNFSIASTDSIIYIIAGRIAYEGFSSGVVKELSLRGVFLPELQSASVFLGMDYLYALQPMFLLSFVLVNFSLCKRIISHILADDRLAWQLSVLGNLIYFSTYFIVFQAFYIHNSMISAVYLFLAVGGFWLAAKEKNQGWMTIGILALLGFSLARTEAPLFAIILLALVVSSGQFSYRILLRSTLPYLFSLTAWYLYLLGRMGEGTYILDPARTLVIIGTLVSFSLLVLLSEQQWIKRLVVPHLPKFMIGSILLLLVFQFIQNPDHMALSFWNTVKNLLYSGRWGITWLMALLLVMIVAGGPRVSREYLFYYGISSFFSLLLAISYFRVPYRLGWGDSANRMSTHILPIILMFILMKIAQALSGAVFMKRSPLTDGEENR
ncbi:MAG: hypothetical protein DRI65_15530 [Chloroflexota bacterium]|nr:MAG: hypothetical protein DRI65_15530 [Chloroflexota bacterium]